VIDGTGSTGFEADVRVGNGRIVELGRNLSRNGEDELDASGCVITPGFIDSHTHYDATLFWDPRCDPIVQHGVTTVLIGNCGLGMAPVRPQETGALGALFSYIEDLPKQVFETQVPWNWESYGAYAAAMRRRPWGLHIASCVSHSLLRQYVIGPDAWERSSTEVEAAQIARLAAEAMEAGAVGVSTSRFDRNPDGRVVPSWYADDAEFDKIFAAVAPYKGIIQTIPTQDDPAKWDDDLRWMGRLSAKYGCPVLSNHIGQRPDNPDNAPRLLEVAREIRRKGGDVRHMISPRSIDIVMNFYQSMVFIYVPAWNEVLQGGLSRDEKKRMLADPQWRARARADFDKSSIPGPLLNAYQFIQVAKPELERWIAHSFGDLLAERGGHPSDVLADWGLENDLDAELLYPLTNTDPVAVGELLAAPENLVSGSDAGAHIAMFDGAGDSTLILTRHVRERGDLTLEEAVRRMTKEQADFLGLKERGIVAPGAVADLTVFKLDELQYGRAVKIGDIPGGAKRFRRPAGGYRYTLVEGVLAQSFGEATEALPGRFLQKADRDAT
jgi:N-acyl-D-aspartate/D-glutamate deacylase